MEKTALKAKNNEFIEIFAVNVIEIIRNYYTKKEFLYQVIFGKNVLYKKKFLVLNIIQKSLLLQ